MSSIRRLVSVVGNVAVLASYCNVVINPLIYILHYDFVRRPLISIAHRIAARLRNQQPP